MSSAGRLAMAPEALRMRADLRRRRSAVPNASSRGARAVLGIQVLQVSHHANRGLHRYVLAHAEALARAGAVAGLDLDPGSPAPNLPEGLMRFEKPARAAVYHVMSPFEGRPLRRLWPAWARRPDTALVVTLYDLIPAQLPETYLNGVRAPVRHALRLELLRGADAVLAISGATAREAVSRAGVDPSRVHEIGAGHSALAPSTEGPEVVAARLARQLPGLRPGYLLHVGGLDPRKNAEGLLRAYASLPAEVRAAHGLVLVGAYGDAELAPLGTLLLELGEDVMLAGTVDAATLQALYQGSRLTVSASRFEGFGLTILEAMASGAAVVASDIPPHRELVATPEARFDPGDTAAIAAALAAGLDDDGLNRALRERGLRKASSQTWERVSERTIRAYEAALRVRSGDSAALEGG